MIQPLQPNIINFKGVEASPALKARVEVQKIQQEPQKEATVEKEPKKKVSIAETCRNTKKGVVGFFKGVNNTTGVTSGIVRGAAEGVVTTAAVGMIAKACKDQNFHIFKTAGQIAKDASSALFEVVKFVPSIMTKAPIENIKTISSLPGKFYKTYLKNNKGAAAIATVVGIAILAFRVIQGKVKANKKNADLDHKTNLGHVK